MKMETWVALASLGLSVMFVALVISFYNFLIGPEGQGPDRVVDPAGLLIQQVSISAGPSIILAVFSFVMAKGTGNKQAGVFLIGAGIIMIAGMFFASTLVPLIKNEFVVGGVGIVPYPFMVAGAGMAGLGGYLASKKARATHLDDLR
ncbi:MAG: hypothetical protein QXJ74_03760 [Nitrososphaera sp.]|uniref:hypothetical protein n=1 Tax=Nitrososphaera sp. TaxID=1971748 RepID=UPI0017E930BA|nr:hypothetical protein [Nitrososphaera sp.]NWG36922.1 hypothetical protein [Nitrososphaera sp.]